MLKRMLQKQTIESFDYQWKMIPKGDAMLDDSWFRDSVDQILTDEILCIKRDWFKGKQVLDAGCGLGRWTIGFLRLGAQVTAVDLSRNAILRTEQNAEKLLQHSLVDNLITYQVNLLDIPFDLKRKKFDLVFSFGVLHHTGNTKKALNNLISLVKHDGILFLYLYGKNTHSSYRRVYLEMRRFLLAPFPFLIKTYLIKIFYRKKDIHQQFDLLSPTINSRYSFIETRNWLMESGFTDIIQTIKHTDLFIRAIKNSPTFNQYLLSPPKISHFVNRYKESKTID